MNADIAKMLEYQKIDGELYKLEKAIEGNKDKETILKMTAIVKESSKLAESLDKETAIKVQEFNEIKKVYEEYLVKAEKATSLDINTATSEEITKVNNELESYIAPLTVVEKKLVALSKTVEQITLKFDEAKQTARNARIKYKQSKDAYDAFLAKTNAEVDRLTQTLNKLKPGLNTSLFNKYKALRQDKIFPVFVPVSDELCGACRMKPSVVMANKLKAQGCIECEHCHRLIYLN